MLNAGAVLSEDCGHRLEAWRIWDEHVPPAVFILLMARMSFQKQGTIILII